MKHRPHNSPLRILEIGPGSGYLGLLLANDGHQYFAMDAAQAFYLYQKKLWSDIFGSDYFDYSESSFRLDTTKVTHIPWWQFANLSIPIPDVDVVTINHALAEMHPNAVKTVFARLYSAWGDTDKKLVLAEGLGYDYFDRKNQMFSNIRSKNFTVNRRAGYTLFCSNQKLAMTQSIDLAKVPSSGARVKSQVTKRVTKLIGRIIRNPMGQQLAKLIKRGSIHQIKVDSAFEDKTRAQTQLLYDFFEDLVSDERTPDEMILNPRTGDIK